MITKWHTHAVYVSGFRTTLKQINDVMWICEELQKYWDNLNK